MMIYKCVYVCVGSTMQDGKRVLECLQRSIKIADVCISSSTLGIFVSIIIIAILIY